MFQRLLNKIARELKERSIPYIVKFASLEDVVIHKIIAGRPRDIEDVKSILLKNSGYDSAYIEKWLKDFEESVGQTFLTIYRGVFREIK